MTPRASDLYKASICYLTLIAAMHGSHAFANAADDPVTSPLPADVERCQRYNVLQETGSPTHRYDLCDTVSIDWDGLRGKLADNGWMITGSVQAGGTFDLYDHAAHPQQYIGQDPSYRANASIGVTYDLTRVGFSGDALLVLNANLQKFTFPGENPSGFSTDSIYVNQRLWNGRLQLQYGYDEIGNQFYGFTLGTNSNNSPAGVNSSIPYEVGFVDNKTAPEINIRVAADDLHVYDRFGVTRSVDPTGPQADWNSNNFWGVKWNIPGAGALYVNELGYRTEPSTQQAMTWIRQGIIYNDSAFTDFRGGSTRDNYAYYLVADRQLFQADENAPFRGLYVNANYNYAPPDRNIYSADTGITFYILGLPAQPNDSIAFGYTFSQLSRSYQQVRKSMGYSAVDYSSNYALSYVHCLLRGVYLSSQLSYTRDPVASPKLPPALTLMGSLSLAY